MSHTDTNTKIVTMPWVEKYRPTDFGDIVLNDMNKKICKNIIDMEYFPNLLFYGPPGTGKTTTIINLVTAFQKKMNKEDRTLMIHLNASDERGIDIIRNQILQFVNSKCLFNDGIKFVILDEVDYMTKNAQQALRYLINMNTYNVRFCLICNYISRIDDGLQTEFLKIRFNNLPKGDITTFLKKIVENEKLNITEDKLLSIQRLYGSDIRSMINFIQCNHIIDNERINIVDNNVWNKLTSIIKATSKKKHTAKKYNGIIDLLNDTSKQYNITVKNIIKDYFSYLIKHKKINITSDMLVFIEKLIHNNECSNSGFVNYTLVNLNNFAELL